MKLISILLLQVQILSLTCKKQIVIGETRQEKIDPNNFKLQELSGIDCIEVSTIPAFMSTVDSRIPTDETCAAGQIYCSRAAGLSQGALGCSDSNINGNQFSDYYCTPSNAISIASSTTDDFFPELTFCIADAYQGSLNEADAAFNGNLTNVPQQDIQFLDNNVCNTKATVGMLPTLTKPCGITNEVCVTIDNEVDFTVNDCAGNQGSIMNTSENQFEDSSCTQAFKQYQCVGMTCNQDRSVEQKMIDSFLLLIYIAAAAGGCCLCCCCVSICCCLCLCGGKSKVSR